MEKHCIMSVDDSAMNHKIIQKLLGETYELVGALSGHECLAKITDVKPDLILLDVTMPDMDGYETCLKLRSNEDTKHTPILFLSGRCGLEEKLKGYEVGGDDYITKPFEAEELLIKIEKNLTYKSESDALTNQATEASAVALSAMRDSSNVGVCLHFMEESFSAPSLPDAVVALFRATKKLNMCASVQVRFSVGDLTYQDDGVYRELEHALLLKVKDQGRFINFGQRIVVNYDCVSMLIKRLPDSEGATFTLAKDCALTLMKGLHARVKALEAELDLQKERDALSRLISKTHEVLSGTQSNFHHLITQSASIMEDAVTEMDQIMTQLHLDEYQEETVMSLMKSKLEKISALHVPYLEEEKRFSEMINVLNRAKDISRR